MKKTQTQSFWRKQAVRFAKFFAISTACLTFLSACDKLNSSPEKLAQITQAEKASRLKRGIYGTQFQLDPHFVTNAAESALVRDLLVGLVAFDPHGNIIPAIAQNWLTEDNKSWLFVLDDKAMWSNGEPVTAKDFVASWQRLATPQTAGTEMSAVLSPLSPYLVYMNVANAQAVISGKKSAEHLGVEALNANTLKITLEKPNAQFPKMLAHTALLPTYQGEIPEATHFVSNGSYVIDEITPEKITLATRQIETPFTTVSYHLLDNDSVAKEMDLVENPPASHKNTATLPRLCTYFYEFNFADPQLAKKEVRQAIKMKIHSARIAGKYGLFNDAILPQAMRENAERQWKPVFFEELLTRAGVSLEQPLRLTLTYDNQGQHGAIANQMVRTLGESDLVRITPQAVDFDQLLAKHSQKDFQLIRSGWN